MPLAAVVLFAAGIGIANGAVAIAGIVAIVLVALARSRARGEVLAMTGCALLAISALAVLVVRARFDPWLNEGAPSTLGALWDVIGRRQYDVAGLWPRQAPLWVQTANWFEYADWQVALGCLGRRSARVGAHAAHRHLRCARHRGRPRALAAASSELALRFAMLFASATVGLIVYLNFKAGASFGWGVLPDSAPHEVRDRDYFFVLGFWVWGAWAGTGAVALAEGLRAQWAPIGALAAALPLVLNAPAADRRAEPERSVARLTALAVLESAPAERGALHGRRQRLVPRVVRAGGGGRAPGCHRRRRAAPGHGVVSRAARAPRFPRHARGDCTHARGLDDDRGRRTRGTRARAPGGGDDHDLGRDA